MGDLGDFGTERPQVDEQFGYFGAKVRVNPDISDLAVVELYRRLGAMGDDEASDVALRIAGALVHPDDVEQFVALAVRNRQTIEDLVTLGLKIVGTLAERPTLLPSGSSDGQQTTGTRSEDGSFSQALKVLEGRPDLQVAVLRRQESLTA